MPRAAAGDPLAGIDADAEFAALVADWHVDTHTAIRDAERELSSEDEDWRLRLQPAPAEDTTTTTSPGSTRSTTCRPTRRRCPAPTAPILVGILLIIVPRSMLFAFGDPLGMPFTLSLFLGVCGVIAALVLFVMRLREYRDEDDDGAVL